MIDSNIRAFGTVVAHEPDPTVRTTYQLMADDIIAELGRRNDAEIARRDAEVSKMVGAAQAAFARRP